MNTAITVFFELHWDGPKFSEQSSKDHPAKIAYDGILSTSKICDPKHPVQNNQDSRFFVLDIPAQEKALCDLIHYCKLGKHSYKIRWFVNGITPHGISMGFEE